MAVARPGALVHGRATPRPSRSSSTGRCASAPAIARAAAAVAALRRGCAAEAGDEPPAEDSDAARVRFWRCRDERAEAQAAAREIEHLLAAGEVRPEAVCVIVGSGWREARLVGGRARGAQRSRSASPGDAALFQRPEVRDVLAWLRMLADPTDSAAVVRALTRPPVELRSIDLARCTAIARRRKLDMVSALEAALESPQLPPEARDRIQAFLKLHARGGRRRWSEMRADVFVRRLIERDRVAAPPAVRGHARRPPSGCRASRGSPSSRPAGRAGSPAARCATSSAT